MSKVASTSIYRSLKKQYQGAVFHAHKFNGMSHDPDNSLLLEYLGNSKGGLKIISLVREPVGRNVSGYFENIHLIENQKSPAVIRMSLEELQQSFYQCDFHDQPLTWFDEELQPNFGFDVYADPFPDEGFVHYKKGRFELLVLNHDLLDELKAEVISSFLGMSQLKIVRSNVAHNKLYYKEYEKFTSSPLTEDYVDRMLRTKYAEHFYKKDL